MTTIITVRIVFHHLEISLYLLTWNWKSLNFNRWWSKVEKWWDFPAVCSISSHLPDLSRSQSLCPEYHEFQVPVLGATCWSSLQTDLVDRSWWKERERESISWVTWKTNKAHTQDLYHSQRHRVSSQGSLESPGEKVNFVDFHVLMRMKPERRTWGTQVSSGARVFY